MGEITESTAQQDDIPRQERDDPPVFVYDHSTTNPAQTYSGPPDPVYIWGQVVDAYPSADPSIIRRVASDRIREAAQLHRTTGCYAIESSIIRT